LFPNWLKSLVNPIRHSPFRCSNGFYF